ncbi:MAG TPA: TonB-dependent receptor [Rhodothermales bacterium]|nr:TonB-dependent receptor [Rhodothermales bacterium]
MLNRIGLILVCLFAGFATASAQVNLSGQVTDADSGTPLPGVNILVLGTTGGTTTSTSGKFSLKVSKLPVTLQFRFVGYETKDVTVSDEQPLNIRLSETVNQSDELIIVGSRFFPRTQTDSPAPIDNIRAQDLMNSGQLQFDKQLMYKVPAYNSTQQTISDATAHFDPADLRGLGPSRTLVLINGKRKNPSSLLYLNDTPGKGEVGVDMKSIPSAAIKRVEILRDGASAQYGSDAIAGVVNIILNDEVEYTDLNFFSGMTTEGDGLTAGFSANTGFRIGTKGFVNFTTGFSDQQETNRAGTPGKDDLFGVPANDPTFGSWLSKHPDLGMRVGQPNMTSSNIFFNATLPVGEAEVYAMGGTVLRKGTSYALYRPPYWKSDPFNLLHTAGTTYEGFQPSFETDILDNTLVMGVRGKKAEWSYDLSSSMGNNKADYTVNNSKNDDLGASSPTSFDTGGHAFSHIVNNLDVSRSIGKINLSFGSEFRLENFVAREGQLESYIGGGTISFPGLKPADAVNARRYNIGFYGDVTADVTKDFLIGGALRYEHYTDFGNTINWKAQARYKLLEDKVVIRASASTGFRAPSLHQIHTRNIQTLVSGGTVSNQGTFANTSPVLRALGVPKLKQEEAFNITAGVALKPVSGLTATLDYYNITVNDRVLFSGEINSSNPNSPVGKVLKTYDVTSIKFFINALNTKTSGVDAVVSYAGLGIGGGYLDVTLSGNVNKTVLEGEPETPTAIKQSGAILFNRKEQARITSARPRDKFTLALDYTLNKATISLNNTRFGEVTWQHDSDPNKDQTFSAKVITDLVAHYRFSKKVGLGVTIANLLNVYPDTIDNKGDVVTDLGGRFKYPWEVNQFGFNGTTLQANLNIRF